VVTIAAIFLALAIGLLGGSAFVQPALQEELQDRTDAAEARAAELRAEIDDLRAQIAGLGGFADAAQPYLTEGRLLGVPVVVVTQAGVEDEVLAETTEALASSGADILTTVAATGSLASEDPVVQGQLAEIVGVPDAAPEELSGLAASELAARLITPVPPPAEEDVLTQLLSGGFLAPVGSAPDATTLEELGSPGQVVVVLSGGQGDDLPLAPQAFAVPLVEALAGLGGSVAAGESLPTRFPYVSLVRAAGLDGVVTVDDLDRPAGGSALVMGLDRLLATGEGGDYGVKDGAEPLPPPP
jgi:hypothetical protein